MKFRKLCLSLVSFLLLFSLCFVTVAYAEPTVKTESETGEKRKEWFGDIENNFTAEEWYGKAEPRMRNDIAYARIFIPDEWNKYKDKIVWTEGGQIAQLNSNDELVAMFFEKAYADKKIKFCDLNRNSVCDIPDARIALRLAVGLDKELPEGVTFEMVDVNLNDKIDVGDARFILRRAVGIGLFPPIAEFPDTYPPAPDYEERSALDFVFGNRENLTSEIKRVAVRARISDPEKWKEYKNELIWDDDGLLAYKRANVTVLTKIVSDFDINDDIIIGDLNKNGEVDVSDARIALRLAVGLDKELPEGITFEMVDVSLNDEIDTADARLILKSATRRVSLENLYREELTNKAENDAK